MLKLIEYINGTSDWEQKLSEKPYCITVKRKDNFLMLNYSQIDSDFYNPIVKECRGIILEDHTYKPVCVPFYKFGNYGEGYVDTIDWNTAKVQEKVDGSLIKVWYYDNEWHISTNGTIDAKDAVLMSDVSEYKTFYDLFLKATNNCGLIIQTLNKNYTYMFELTSPYNRVVVPYQDIAIRHIGTRDNKSLEELNIDIRVDKPKSYNFTSLDQCISMAKELPFSDEGYVVVDNNWHRIKIKSPAYVAAHHLKNNGIVTKERIVEMIRQNEEEEFLNYYPEYLDGFQSVLFDISVFANDIEHDIDYAKQNIDLNNRKEFALYATKTKCPAALFCWLDGKYTDATDWIWQQSNEKIVKMIG